jgi:hypothetical protein
LAERRIMADNSFVWPVDVKNVAVLQDCGHVLLFRPLAAELHAQAGKWFADSEIYE